MGSANYVIGLYGVQRFFADIDRDRQFARDAYADPATANAGSVVHSILDWVVNEGFPAFMEQYDLDYDSPYEFRNRFLIAFLKRGA